ncbi:MAG: hypothetical protein Aurels2KO_21210 [Aureliella sp.]
MPKFGIFIPSAPDMHVTALNAFSGGLEACGASIRKYELEGGYRSCEVAVTFGVAKEMTERGRAVGKVLRAHRERRGAGQNIVIERGFVHRDRYYMIGWGGLNGRADFRNVASPSNRWTELSVELKPWRSTGRHIVLCGQVPWDASVQHTNHESWCRETARQLLSCSDRPVRFRPHPMQPNAVNMNGLEVEFSSAKSLEQDLRDAWAVVTFNSNAGVEATIAGVPAFAADPGAMGFPIVNSNLQSINDPIMPDRTQWTYNLGYTQWTVNEMNSGLPQAHLWQPSRTWRERLITRVRQLSDFSPRRSA